MEEEADSQDLLSFQSCRSSEGGSRRRGDSGVSEKVSGRTNGNKWDCSEGDESMRRRCVEAGTRR